MARRLRIAFLHPDLGLGGAERLIVDAAAELASHDHTVDIYTAHYDPERCFEETKSGAFSVFVAGAWFPRNILGRFHALCAVIRCCIACLCMAWKVWSGSTPDYDVIIVDQVAAVVPLLKLLLQGTRILFYCHFPDLLLTQRTSLLKAVYRAPLDALEESATGMSDLLLVNSSFTAGVFTKTFHHLAARGVRPAVLYPAVSVPPSEELKAAAAAWEAELGPELVTLIKGKPMFLSINRFERKKGLGLGLQALAELHSRRPDCKAVLVVAGGYDTRLAENREHLQELKQQAAALEVADAVAFVPSFTDRQRTLLLAACRAVVYTPQLEHFGIVPLEAMAACRPVVACNNGGPTESIVHGTTGFLCEPTPAAFAEAFGQLLDEKLAAKMGKAARAHVKHAFSRGAFGNKLNEKVLQLANGCLPSTSSISGGSGSGSGNGAATAAAAAALPGSSAMANGNAAHS